MKNVIFIFCLIISGCSTTNKKTDYTDPIIGTYYNNIYLNHDINNSIYLKKDLPTGYDTIYIPENDIVWQFDFEKSGNIKIQQLVPYSCVVYCLAYLKSGKWERKSDKYIITINHYTCGSKPDIHKDIYKLITLNNSDKKLSRE